MAVCIRFHDGAQFHLVADPGFDRLQIVFERQPVDFLPGVKALDIDHLLHFARWQRGCSGEDRLQDDQSHSEGQGGTSEIHGVSLGKCG